MCICCFTHAKQVPSPPRSPDNPHTLANDAPAHSLSISDCTNSLPGAVKPHPDVSAPDDDSNSLLDAEGETDDENAVEHIPRPLAMANMGTVHVRI